MFAHKESEAMVFDITPNITNSTFLCSTTAAGDFEQLVFV